LKRFNRLFESFGESYGNRSAKFEQDIKLDSHNLTAGEKLKTVKAKVINDLSTLGLKVNVCRTFRKAQLIARYPVAEFMTLDGRSFLPSSVPVERKLTLIKPNGVKPMNVNELLNDEVATLSNELKGTDKLMGDAARRGDETGLVALSDRKAQLPELIQKAKMRNFAERLSVARSRVAAYDTELQNAVREAGTLATKVETDVPVLQAEIERLRSASAQAQHERDNLQFAAKQARDELARIQNERESLLLGHYGT
jgi:FtsZ-binding cell division protein ZapB